MEKLLVFILFFKTGAGGTTHLFDPNSQGGFGDFYSNFLDEGRGGRNEFDRSDLQKAMSSPRAAGFSFANNPN